MDGNDFTTARRPLPGINPGVPAAAALSCRARGRPAGPGRRMPLPPEEDEAGEEGDRRPSACSHGAPTPPAGTMARSRARPRLTPAGRPPRSALRARRAPSPSWAALKTYKDAIGGAERTQSAGGARVAQICDFWRCGAAKT